MAANNSSCLTVFLLLPILLLSLITFISADGNFVQDFDIVWGNKNARVLNGGKGLKLSLDKSSGSAFVSKQQYLFGRIDMHLKLVAGNSAGTVTTYYLSSKGRNHDEIDFEFLGNASGQPYTLHTNVFAQGKGQREQQFRLWFDPTIKFHQYSVVWNPHRIMFLVDDIPIRVFENHEAQGIAFPHTQPMKLYSSIWNADDWATQGGRVKTDWSKAPFTASYKNFNAQACVWSSGSSSCAPSEFTASSISSSSGAWQTQGLDAIGTSKLKWVQQHFMIYNYCTDFSRFPQGVPPECKLS